MTDEHAATPKKTRLELIQEKREKRKAEREQARDEQLAIDLEAIDDLEVEHGDGNIVLIHMPYTEGLPVVVAARTPRPAEVKRYRDRLKVKPGKTPDTVAAAEELAAVVRVYPDEKTYQRVLEERPGIHVQLGVAAMNLATGKAEEEGKG